MELFSFNNVNETQMETQIKEINTNKSSGMDDIPTNIYVANQQFLNKLKNAIVTRLFKKDDNTDKANYRTINVLPSVSIFFERLLFKQISNFVQNKISQHLCGHRKGFYTQHALMRLLDKLNKSVDKGVKIGLLMMDLSKVFDCITRLADCKTSCLRIRQTQLKTHS